MSAHLKSFVTGWRRRDRLLALVAVAALAFFVDTAYITASASPSIMYVAAVLAHVAGGVLLAGALVVILWRCPDLRRTLAPSAIVLAPAVALGVYLAWRGNTSDQRIYLWAHIGTASLGVLVLLTSTWLGVHRAAPRWVTWRIGLSAACALMIALPAAARIYERRWPDASHRIHNPRVAPLSMHEEGGGPSSPFFPSSAQTNVGGVIPANFFMDSQACGECHRDIYQQWRSSAHRFASMNNQFYRKSIEYMQDVVGTKPSKWCAGCHDHAVFFNGRFDRPIREQIDTPEAHAGLACTSCHSIVHVAGSMGNGGFTIEYPPLHALATSSNPLVRPISKYFTYLDPEPHRRSFMKPFMRADSAEFCASCHKVHLDVPVNQYRWMRGFNDYDSWQASGVSGQGARSFYYPARTATCADCHMPLVPSRDPGNHDGKVHSHRFPAANTAVPFVNHDRAQLESIEKFLTSGFVTVDIFAVTPAATGGRPIVRRAGDAPSSMTTFAVGEEAEQAAPVVIRDVGAVAAPIDRAAPAVARGSDVRVDVVVRTRKIGHFFPGGTVDAFDVWLELQARDADGKLVFWSGQVEDDGRGPVEAGAHFYRSYLLDEAGNPVNKRNAWQARSLLYARLIPPGAADVAHFRLRVPPDAKGPLTLVAKLNHRKFSHYYTQFAYAGRPKPGQPADRLAPGFNSLEYDFDAGGIPANVSGAIKGKVPELPIVTLAEAETRLPLCDDPGEVSWSPRLAKDDRERWNDWGIGLLLQGDLKGAEYAFRQVTQIDPSYADGWLNVARALIQEGQTEAAKPFLDRALQIDASLGRIHYFRSLVQKADGDYDAALQSLRRVAGQYPRDRVVLNQLARVLFLKREFREALQVLEGVAAVDPEDIQMHYTMMLCYRALRDTAGAAREEQLFRRFKADEASQAITARRRSISPEDNNERQSIHEHESVPTRARPAMTSSGTVSIVLAAVLVGTAAPTGTLQFVDVTAASGVRFTHNSGRAGRKWLPETLGAGTAIFDADGDGWLDLLFVNGRDWEPKGRPTPQTLYRNLGNGTFVNITRGSGLDVTVYGLGVAVGDYDNDGRPDVYLTALEGDRLFRNLGGGRFGDVTAGSGIANANFGTSAAWLDYDRDGQLDVFVANYVQWTAAADLACSLDGESKSYCTPESYKGTASRLFRNRGAGANPRFEDVSVRAGVGDPTSKSLGVAVLDYDRDGWPDLFVANDTQPNKLYRNRRNGTFIDEGMVAGVAYGEDGVARGAMGVDAADYDRSGRPHLLVGNFSNQMLGLYHNDGQVFVDEAPASAVGRASLLTLAFAVFFADWDLDGYADIFAANGHIEEEIGRVQPRVQYRQPPLVFRNKAGKGFDDITASLGAALNRPVVARGAAHGDLDRDGDRDLVITTNHGPAYVYRNDGGNRNNWIAFRLTGTRSNRSAIGATVRVESASGKQWDVVRSGSSYCSQSDLGLTFGLGADRSVSRATVMWPSGLEQELGPLAGRQEYRIEEPTSRQLTLPASPAGPAGSAAGASPSKRR